MDDSKDKEFSRPPYLYYPLASDRNRGGLGLRELKYEDFNGRTYWLKILSSSIMT